MDQSSRPLSAAPICGCFFLLLILSFVGCGGGGNGGSGNNPVQTPTITSLSMSCNPTTVTTGQTSQCAASVQGTGNFSSSVNWSVNNIAGGNSTVGTVSSSGLYTAPSAVPNPQTVNITAVSVEDSTKSSQSTLAIWRTTPSGSWQHTGPNAGTITVLAEDLSTPNVVYASSSWENTGGLWKSTDGGQTWSQFITNSLLDQTALADIAIENGGQTIYAACRGDCFFKSLDGGQSWTQTQPTQQPASTVIGAMAVNPQNGSVIYLSVPGQGVLQATDGGSTWRLLSGSPVIGVSSKTAILRNPLLVDPAQPSTLYYGTDHGFYVSRDGGTTWAGVTNGFSSGDTAFFDVATDSANNTFVIAGAPLSPYVDLYESGDHGNTWTALAQGLAVERIIPDAFTPGVIYLYGLANHYVYKSTDGGTTFAASDNGMPPAPGPGGLLAEPTGTMLSLTSARNALLATAIGQSVFRSQDGAQSWTSSTTGISRLNGADVAVDPENPSTVYLAAVDQGVYKSTDSGMTWRNIRWDMAHTVAVDPFDSSHLLAAAFDEGLIESNDGGASWQVVSNLPPPQGGTADITGLAFHPVIQGAIFVSTRGGGLGLVRSTDGGMTWNVSNGGLITDDSETSVAFDPQDAKTLFLGTGIGIFDSTDGGNNWSLQTAALVRSISIDSHTTPPTVYAAGSNLYKSGDLGQTWTTISVPFSGLGMVVTVDPSSLNSIFVAPGYGQMPQIVEWSPDGGNTWIGLNDGLGDVLLTFDGYGMAIAKSEPQMLFVVSGGNSIVRFAIGP